MCTLTPASFELFLGVTSTRTVIQRFFSCEVLLVIFLLELCLTTWLRMRVENYHQQLSIGYYFSVQSGFSYQMRQRPCCRADPKWSDSQHKILQTSWQGQVFVVTTKFTRAVSFHTFYSSINVKQMNTSLIRNAMNLSKV